MSRRQPAQRLAEFLPYQLIDVIQIRFESKIESNGYEKKGQHAAQKIGRQDSGHERACDGCKKIECRWKQLA